MEARQLAMTKISDQMVLADIAARSDSFCMTGIYARNTITDQDALVYIMEHSNVNTMMRVGTIKRITDMDVVRHYAENDKSEIVRDAAKEILSNQG